MRHSIPRPETRASRLIVWPAARPWGSAYSRASESRAGRARRGAHWPADPQSARGRPNIEPIVGERPCKRHSRNSALKINESLQSLAGWLAGFCYLGANDAQISKLSTARSTRTIDRFNFRHPFFRPPAALCGPPARPLFRNRHKLNARDQLEPAPGTSGALL